MNNIKRIVINKNRGWRGLAEVRCIDDSNVVTGTMIFSFSQAIWDDLVYVGVFVMQDSDFYYVLAIDKDDKDNLPVGQQRSVLIKNWTGDVTKVNRINKRAWTAAEPSDYVAITHFLKNKNNHTQSDWNCIGIRVKPEI